MYLPQKVHQVATSKKTKIILFLVVVPGSFFQVIFYSGIYFTKSSQWAQPTGRL